MGPHPHPRGDEYRIGPIGLGPITLAHAHAWHTACMRPLPYPPGRATYWPTRGVTIHGTLIPLCALAQVPDIIGLSLLPYPPIAHFG